MSVYKYKYFLSLATTICATELAVLIYVILVIPEAFSDFKETEKESLETRLAVENICAKNIMAS